MTFHTPLTIQTFIFTIGWMLYIITLTDLHHWIATATQIIQGTDLTELG